MPLRIEALFCDLALEREVLSADELARCITRAGEAGRVHAAAVELGVVTQAQAGRLYAAVYAALDVRHDAAHLVRVQCGACGAPLAARFALAYPVAPCPVCLADVDLVARRAGPPAPIDEPAVETAELTALAHAVRVQVATERAELPREVAGMTVLERLADHGVGSVYRVRDGEAHRVVRAIARDNTAIDVAAVLRQSQRLAALEHPNIRPLARVLRSKESVFLVSAYHPGQDLDQLRAASGGRLRPQLVLKVAYQVARALEHAHKAGVLHGGLSPGRILVGDDRRVLVLDFGLAPGAEAIAEYLVSGTLDGLPGYLSPEQCLGRGTVDARSDLYSLGLVMYAGVCGGLPFGDDPAVAAYRQAHAEVPSISRVMPDLAPGVAQLVSRLVAREPDERYPDATTLLRDLEYLMSGQAPTFARPSHLSAARMARGQRVRDARAQATGERISFVELIERQGSHAASATSEVVSAGGPSRAPDEISEVVSAGSVSRAPSVGGSEVVSAGDESYSPHRTRPVPPPAPAAPRPLAPFEGDFLAAYEAGHHAAALAILLARYDADRAFEPRWSYYRAACLWRVERYDEALADLGCVLEREPGHVEAHFLRGLVHQARGAEDLARDAYTAVIALDSRHVKARCNRGALLQAAGDRAAAAADFKAALEVNPRHVRSLVGMGVVALERDQHELAEDFLDQALAIDAAAYLAVYAKARLAVRQARPREALAHLSHAARQLAAPDAGGGRPDALRALADAEPDFALLRENPKLRVHYRTVFAGPSASAGSGGSPRP